MLAWSKSLLDVLDECLAENAFWTPNSGAGRDGLTSTRSVHLAVFVQPFLRFLLEGRKTIESRFSVHRRAPSECVRTGDIVFVKESGGPIVAAAEVSDVWYYHLDPSAREFIRKRFAKQLCVEPEFWERKADSCYATLMQFSHIHRLHPINCMKRDRRGWVVLASSNAQKALFSKTGVDSR